jgi:hypothetical protein
MKKLLEVGMLVVVMSASLVLAPISVFAAAPVAATNGYRLSPVRTDLTIKPGASEVVTVYIQNASSAVEHLQVVINDFEAPTNETGNPALLLNGANAPQHSLKQFITVSAPTFTLQPTEQKAVSVLLKIPDGTAAGGYYGAIRFAPVGTNGNKNVNLSASVASLVLVTVPGNLVEQLSIAGFGVVQASSTTAASIAQPRTIFFNNKNLQALVRFQNSGNVQEQPFGKVLLKKGSTTEGTFAVNDAASPGNVLPNSIRRFTVKINKVGWFGKYKLQGNFGYGSKGQLLTAQSTFYVIPVPIIIAAAIIVLFIVFLIFGLPKLIRRYNRRVITRANRRR